MVLSFFLFCLFFIVITQARERNEPNCYESEEPGMYKVFTKTSPVTKWLEEYADRKVGGLGEFQISHWLVEYRGFVYEFGKPYGFQELDVNDPYHKYRREGPANVLSSEEIAISKCTRNDTLAFIAKVLEAYPQYKLFGNNCQDFVEKLLKELKDNCTARNPPRPPPGI